MATLSEMIASCKVTLTNGLTGTRFRVERLAGRPGDYRKGFRLTCPIGQQVFCHELPGGVQECNCSAWTRDRDCEHCQLLTAAGLFAEPARYNPFEDELVEIEWENEAP